MSWMDEIGRRIKLRDLRLLHATVEAGSMAKAARTLSMSQPAISYALSEMEKVLGVPLLERSAQGVTPTDCGRALLDRSKIVFNELRLGLREIEAITDPAIGELAIGTTPPMSAVASAVINSTIQTYPRMTFHLVNEPTQVLISKLRQREIEIAITRMVQPNSDDDLGLENLFDDQLAVIAGRSNRWVRHRNPTLSELYDEPWVFQPPGGYLFPIIRQAFASHGLEPPKATVTTPSTHAMAMLVANGPFLAIHPEAMLKIPTVHPSLSALPVELPSTRNPISLVTLANRSPSKIAQIFAKTAREVVKGIKTGIPRRTIRKA